MALYGDINSTSSWVKFFTEGGIPHNVAANYAVTFVDNRITKSMLLDLSKEILQDMGIGVMGDIIAILKHAKLVHAQMTRDKVYQEESPVVSVPPARRSTQQSLKRKAEEEEEAPVQKVSRIVPEDRGSYVVSLPSQTTHKTLQLAMQQVQQPSVFGRLAQKANTVTNTKPLKTRILTKNVSPKVSTEASSVFDRLGPGRGLVSSTTVTKEGDEDVDNEGRSAQLQYKGILKPSPPTRPASRVVQTKATGITPAMLANASSIVRKIPVTKRLGPKVQSATISSESQPKVKKVLQAATVSSCSEGIFAPGANLKKVVAVKNRLGPKTQETGIQRKLTTKTVPVSRPGGIAKLKKLVTYSTRERTMISSPTNTSVAKIVKKPMLKKTVSLVKPTVSVMKPTVSVSFVSTPDVFSRLGPAVDDLE